jgi:hypothetical protein
MSDVLIDVLMAVAGLVVLYGLAALVKPFWLIKHRLVGGVVAFVAMVVLAILYGIPPSRPANIPPDVWAKRVTVCKAAMAFRTCAESDAEVNASAASVLKATKERAEAAAQSTEAASSASSESDAGVGPPGSTPPASPEVKASFLATQATLLNTFAPCDQMMDRAAKARGQYASYAVAVAGKAACWQTMAALNDVRFADPLPNDLKDPLNAAVDCFAQAYELRYALMNQGAVIMNGDMRPSAVAEFRGDLAAAVEKSQECRMQYLTAAASHGLAEAAKPVALGRRG